ncbi:hypothetical protein [Mammaliicoccus sciuri]|uniref:hypothetical protein n=1 Tax=Mammaliicoccus sciuri TaxID=1296 RepID=UPI002B25957D|nr:hypothetical protein [Mammaliicoccus sciuri]MEB6233817.1 hypothetical protein [Mammaliicoccus sciuri]WQL61701.1 hypothetical protein P3T96_15085 [Mammaliicoccus sciuri]
MQKKLITMILTAVMLLTVFSVIENNEAQAVKKGQTVTIKGKKYIYQGKVKHYFPKGYTKQVQKLSKTSQSWLNFAGGTGIASVFKSRGYGVLFSASTYMANQGIQNNTKVYKTAAKKNKGVEISYDLYVPKTGNNYGLKRNQKIVYR